MKKITLFLMFAIGSISFTIAQTITTPPSSKKASVTEYIGLSEITVKYFRPGVKGREGKIWGGLVPYDGGTPWPWRAGADDNTTIYFEQDVTIEGQSLPAGTYGFHVIPSKTEWILIFSKNHTSWGSYNYDKNEDALRVTIQPTIGENVEWLRYQFINQTENSADIELAWEKQKGSFKIEMDVHAITMQNIRNELRNLQGFAWEGWNSAAFYCLQSEKDLEQGLKWAERSIAGGFGSTPTYTNLQTKGKILEKLNRPDEAKASFAQSIELANMTELHFYARGLIQAGKKEEAMKMFQLNRDRNPKDDFTTIVGLARGNEAVGNKLEAIKYFRMAAKTAPPEQAAGYEDLAKKLENSK